MVSISKWSQYWVVFIAELYFSRVSIFITHLPNCLMTVPKETRDLLMLPPSLNLWPVAPVDVALSLKIVVNRGNKYSLDIQNRLSNVIEQFLLIHIHTPFICCPLFCFVFNYTWVSVKICYTSCMDVLLNISYLIIILLTNSGGNRRFHNIVTNKGIIRFKAYNL